MPIGARPKPPAQTKAELMAEIQAMLQRRYSVDPTGAIEYLLNFYTALDLVGIRDELKGERR